MKPALETRSPVPAAGLYRPDEIFWTVNREAVLLLTGVRALLLQVAHPLVAAGVAEHSRFREEPLGRLRRTLDAMLAMIYGPGDETETAAGAVNCAHARVHGRLDFATARLAAGTPYAASDPDLALWVHTTLVDSALVGYETFVRKLDAAEREAFVQQSNRIGPLLGIPHSHAFASAAAFDAHLAEVLGSGILEVTPQGAAVADSVLRPFRWIPRPLAEASQLASLALLHDAVRDAYGIPWTPGRERAWRALRAAVRLVRPLLPAPFRLFPRARRAERERRP